MAVFDLLARQDHLEKVANTREPVRALAEFVWNALDADATHVEVDFVLNALGGIDRIEIRDNGTGISHARAERDFANLGNSWKRKAPRTPGLNRAVHGKEGRGRLRFYSLSEKASWRSTYQESGQTLSIGIEISAAMLDKCLVTDAVLATDPTVGTVVELYPLKSTFAWLQSQEAFLQFSSLFAPYILRYPDVRIYYNKLKVDPASTIAHSYEFSTQTVVGPTRTISDLILKVIEWNSAVEARKIHLGGENGIVLGSQSAHVVAPDFQYSAYAYSSFFQEIADANLLEFEELSDPDFRSVMDHIREQLNDYFRARQAERSRTLIDELKSVGAYPYEGDPRDEVERRERQVFDIATFAVSSYSREFKKSETSVKRMTLTFLREAIRHNPDALSTILRAVVNLPKNRQDEFSNLLQKTELGNIISASSLIADRIITLEVLKGMVFNPAHRYTVRERGELDTVVRDNTWIFGERFHITMPEAGLSKVMERVSEELGTKRKRGQVRKADGSAGRLDCFLGRSVPLPDHDKREFLVVELKRPSIKVGRTELDQLEDYVNALKAQPDYRHTHTTWNFYLITGEYDTRISDRVNQKDRPVGLFVETENSRVWIKTWSELIRDCESRLQFIQNKLQIEVSGSEIEQRITSLRSAMLKEGTRLTMPPANTDNDDRTNITT